MKLTRIKIILAAAFALAGAFSAAAQSNGGPGDADYAKFSQFITERNIFDPNRYPRTQTTAYRPRTRTRPRTAGAPTFTLVGTMSYQKGRFVFFDGNSSDLKKILANGESIAGYTVEEITATSVKLLGADKKKIVMKIGDQMRQEGSVWQLADQGESSAGTAVTETPAVDSGSSTDETTAPSPALQGNDVLKRLMQQREQELK